MIHAEKWKVAGSNSMDKPIVKIGPALIYCNSIQGSERLSHGIIEYYYWQRHFNAIHLCLRLSLCYLQPLRQYYSFYHLAKNYINDQSVALPLLAFLGVVSLIGWVVYLRAAARALGFIGIILAIAFFGTLLWLAIYYDVLSVDRPDLCRIDSSNFLLTHSPPNH